MVFSDNWKEYPDLCERIEQIRDLHQNALAMIFPPLMRTAVCRHSDEIKIEIPKTFSKNYFVAEEFSRSLGKHENIRDIHLVSFHISEVENICFLLHCIGEKIGYGIPLENSKYPEVVDFLNKNHPMYALANEVTKTLLEYKNAPSVYYAEPIESARKTINNFRKEQNEKINELYTELMASGKVQIRWKSEYKLYSIVKKTYPDAVYQFRSEWLKSQSLDIFIPSIMTGIEYQGKQHYEPVALFGGDDTFQGTKTRDERKARKCAENGVRLLYWKYDVPISVNALNMLLGAE